MPLLYSRVFALVSNRRRALSTRRTQINSPRQLPPITSTSSFNWWPYPPWGATTTSTSTQNPAATITTTTLLPIQPATPTTAISEVLSSTLIAPSTTLVSSKSSSSTAFSTIFSPSDSLDVITITGTGDSQPGVPSETVVEHPVSNNQNLNMILIPVFVVLGVVVGSVIAWFVYGCFNRKPGRGRRRSELEVGPAYSPPSLSSMGTGFIQEKIPLSAGDNSSDDGHSWHALDINGEDHVQHHATHNERAALLDGPQPVDPTFLAPLISNRKPLSSAHGLSRAKTGASVSVYSQLGDVDDDDGFDQASFVGESTLDSKYLSVPPLRSLSKKNQTLNSNSMRRVPTIATTTTMASSDTRTVSLSRRRPTCPRDDTNSTDEWKRNGDLSRTNTAKTTKTTRTTNSTTTTRSGTSAAMSFRIAEESPLPTPLHGPPATDASGFSWAGVGEMLWGSGNSSDRYTNLPDRGERSPLKRSTVGDSSGGGTSTRTRRTRSKSVLTTGERSSRPGSRAGLREREEDQERILRDYYGYGSPLSGSNHKLPQSPPQVTSPKLEGDLCFSPVIGQGR